MYVHRRNMEILHLRALSKRKGGPHLGSHGGCIARREKTASAQTWNTNRTVFEDVSFARICCSMERSDIK